MDLVNSQRHLPQPTNSAHVQAMRLARRYLFATGVKDAATREQLALHIVNSAGLRSAQDGDLPRHVLEAAHALLVDSVARNLMRNDLAGFADTEQGALLFRDLRGRTREVGRDTVLTGKFRRLSAMPPMQPAHMVSNRVASPRYRARPSSRALPLPWNFVRGLPACALCILLTALMIWPR